MSRLNRRFSVVVALSAMGLVVLWIFIFGILRTLYHDSNVQAISAGRNLARNIAEKEKLDIESVDVLSRYLRAEWVRNRDNFERVLKQHDDFLVKSKITQAAIIGRDGIVEYSNIAGWKPIDLSDRPHFKVHLNNAADEMYVSAPVLGRISKIWTVQFTRKILDEKGEFVGVVVISIPPPALSRSYKDFDLGGGAAIAYVRFDGQIIGHSDDLSRVVGVNLAGTPGLSASDPEEGQYRRKSRVDGEERIYRYHKVGGYPFSIIVGQSVRTVFASYNNARYTYIFAGVVTSMLILLICLLFLLRIKSGEKAAADKKNFENLLRESEERFRIIAETIDAVIWSGCEREGYYVNAAYKKIWGCFFAKGLADHPMLLNVYGADEDIVRQSISALESGQSFNCEYRILNGMEIRWIWGQAYPVLDGDHHVLRGVGFASDITERKKIQEEIRAFSEELEERVLLRTSELQEANQALIVEKNAQKVLIEKLNEAQSQLIQSEKLASIGQLAAGVAHEINNPIGFVSSNVMMLQRYCQTMLDAIDQYESISRFLDEDGVKCLELIRQNNGLDAVKKDVFELLSESKDGLDRVKKIVQDLKDFSRVGTANADWADLEQGLESTINVVWNELKYKAEVVRRYAGIPAVKCIPSQINQVFMNLLMNSVQAIPQRGRIVVGTGFDDDNVWIDIEDNGAGISGENIKKIFEPFFTTKPVGQGTGLGLSLSYGIIQKHRGRIEVESKVGVGSKFRVVLPRD